MSDEKELAYRYDLFIAPDWRERFDELIAKHIKLPREGRILDLNCGTGGYTIEVAERLREKGEVVGVDSSAERLEIARAKALVRKVSNVTFEQSLPYDLRFDSEEFNVVIGDVSMLPNEEVEDVLSEMVRVVEPAGRVVLRIATHGSFDEFFSIFWEALHDLELSDEVWSDLQALINERPIVSDVEDLARRAGLRQVVSFTSKEDFPYESADDFLTSPLIGDVFLAAWLDIVPENRREEVYERVNGIIERELVEAPFEVSIKATLISGVREIN
jgi:ubiquinone/menaquinone biosynthesis C-methylase UbiE